MEKLNVVLAELLKECDCYYSEDGELLKNAVYEDAMKMDSKLIKLLLSDERCKKAFFTNVDGVFVFDKVGFGWVISNRQFLPDSYTRYKNKIGLTDNDGNFISTTDNVVLSFPYKDCVLAGGQSKEEQKREEVFYNETLAPEDVDRLLFPKVFAGAKRYTQNGVEENIVFSEKDNLIIKGNNLLAISSLLKKYEGKIKLIYWDIPYNTGNDSFGYNDKFNHSTWLVFIKNRLEKAKSLLRKDGVCCIQCDDNEMAYLKVLCDEIFGRENHINTICVKMSELKGFKMGNLQNKFPKLKEYLLIYGIDKSLVTLKNESKLKDNLELYTKYYNKRIVNLQDDCASWKVENVPKSFDKIAHAHEMIYLVTRDSSVKQTLPVNQFYKSVDKEGKVTYLYYDGSKVNTVLFLSEYIKEPVGDIWMDISTININKESSVQLDNGKKPEALLSRILFSFTNEGDCVLDAFLGTGTTAAVAHKMKRKFIGLEQLSSHYEKCITRLKEVVDGDKSGVSKEVDWQGGGSFVYCELAQLNQNFVDSIQNAKDEKKLAAIWGEMRESGFISSYVKPSEINPEAEDFASLSFEDKKRLFIALLDKNMLYVNYCDIDDETYAISESDKRFTNSFYSED